MNCYVFDDGKGTLAPLTDFRASFDIRSGAFTMLERVRVRHRVLGLFVPAPIESLTREAHPEQPVNPALTGDEPIILLNGRAPLAHRLVAALSPNSAAFAADGDLVAACVPAGKAAAVLAGSRESLSTIASLQGVAAKGLSIMTRPWHVRSLRDPCLDEDLAAISIIFARNTPALPPGVFRIGDKPCVIDPPATIFPSVVLDTSSGPIVIDDHVTIRPGAIIAGPVYLGPHVTVLDGALIKPHTAIGPWCKVAGEVGGTIFQGFANKAHDGHLGDSYIGEWVNLGAGTTNSNLLNTYGEVICKATPTSSNERSGEQFLGAIIGDHVKTAICTRLMTGTILHTGSMFAQSKAVAGTVAPFSWCTDDGSKSFRVEKFIEVMHAAMARRKKVPSQAYLARVRALADTASS
jgi:UDP-N-acetylglucosamine diphosphorylase / glucose-1-phosphate thymidylyltransferase / UDP-N-acetylgalactosamine diphosphorylase / glucosamine-1-phosphate N-acetyltransferase / galactosamine-1-phosphate N-acetyltransferase